MLSPFWHPLEILYNPRNCVTSETVFGYITLPGHSVSGLLQWLTMLAVWLIYVVIAQPQYYAVWFLFLIVAFGLQQYFVVTNVLRMRELLKGGLSFEESLESELLKTSSDSDLVRA